ncbi:hypothetical protein GXP67_01560 [Rhodocytophaga rosea]|uniref:Uncharacterized protein n=1 Tax=Rhodocytophaga rosea TaxID=2704465 RepID=A0A6C0GCA1_9BACT|nr:hypothetical protein [Rhodocytophaga rosea]QHT65453.1 hypothetical protein GXP67_01560 [Rhodocytophaga rosea]
MPKRGQSESFEPACVPVTKQKGSTNKACFTLEWLIVAQTSGLPTGQNRPHCFCTTLGTLS